MSFIILTNKTAKLPIDPVYKTNWCDLSAKLKLKCIGKMELKERLSLRRTAKAERSLVDSQKIAFPRGRVWSDSGKLTFTFYHENGNEFKKYFSFRNLNDAYKFMNYILNVAVFQHLQTHFRHSNDNKMFLNYIWKISAKNIIIANSNNQVIVPILRKLDGVETIIIHENGRIGNMFDTILAIPQVRNARYWHIGKYYQTDSLHKVAQMWINTNSKVGSTFQVCVYEDGSFRNFLMHFADRIVSKNDTRVRIRTNNPDHHILLERGFDETACMNQFFQYFRLMVISAEMKESEYEEDCKEWVRKMRPEIYDKQYIDDEYSEYGHVSNYHIARGSYPDESNNGVRYWDPYDD